jgi:cytoskeletal protein CcmA (bactofilin family)
MAVFSSSQGDKTPGARGNTGESGLSILASGMRVVGEIVSNGVVKVEGTVEGSVQTEGQVLVSPGGLVAGDIRTREAIIGGQVRGGIFAEERVEVQSGSSINGDISTPRLVIHEGGDVNGQIKMGKGKSAPTSVPKEAAAQSREATAPKEGPATAPRSYGGKPTAAV